MHYVVHKLHKLAADHPLGVDTGVRKLASHLIVGCVSYPYESVMESVM